MTHDLRKLAAHPGPPPAAGTSPSSSAERIDAIRAAAGALVPATPGMPAPADLSAYLADYYAQADAEELARDPRMLAAAALSHLRFAALRAPGTAKIRVFNPTLAEHGYESKHTVIDTVNDDMPFLVDSLTMNLSGAGQAIHVTVHPLLQVRRTPAHELASVGPLYGAPRDSTAIVESWIHIEIVRETDPEILRNLETMLERTLADVRAAVDDWQPMLAKLAAATEELRRVLPPGELLEESCAFLEWLTADHFTLLGYRQYALVPGADRDELVSVPGTGLGLLRDDAANAGIVKLSGAPRQEARSKNPLVITKDDRRSTVHRPAALDHVGVKIFGAHGIPTGERRFLGLFTSAGYNESPRRIPWLRLKIRRLMEESGLDRESHRGKTLQHVLETLPRDDLYQASLADLRTIAAGAVALRERHRVRLFVRREVFGRYYSCLVYLPRSLYGVRAHGAIEQIVLNGLGGTSVESRLTISESALARIEVTVYTSPYESQPVPTETIEREIENAVRSWGDRLREALLAAEPEDRALGLLHRYGEHFSAAYQDEADTARAARDVVEVAAVHEGLTELAMSLERSQTPGKLRFTTFKRGEPIPLHTALPILEHMGVKVISERVYTLRLAPEPVRIQDFELEPPAGRSLDAEEVGARLEDAFRHVLQGDAESDGFNGFVLTGGLTWREAMLLRAYCKYVLQTGILFSQSYMLETLARYPTFGGALIDKLAARFDPDLPAAERGTREAAAETAIAAALASTVSLDDDRILRAFASVVEATLRTNYYQHDSSGGPKPYVSFKLDPSKIAELPKPRPKYEVFVYSPRVEAVHLRASKIARGGIRWSDRREDFRTEVLGLMKAQQVKNTVIVPNGAKGGFFCKSLPIGGSRDAVQREVVECYKTFIRGLLDITDNVVDEHIVTPARVIRRDDDDPYLVVAADKGTATFSDLANGLAAEYGFWLADAFASGGSAGYDHKKMGITARGAWESVKRAFRELGIDARSEPFTAVGIGDMSGDVFGNGMLLAPSMRLVAAFNHQHIFVDPAPDAEQSCAERQRLFELPRSTWEDYDRGTISAGGGVYPRSSKSIELSAEAQAALGVSQAVVTPPELIRAILQAPVDLLWNGGIGTYVKSSRESHLDASDPSNDGVRVDGSTLRARVVGEGGNLGFTQLGRVEYAQAGGRISTDFIDNSGGVDSSDREVNIKILLADAIRRRALPAEERDALLASMTDDVAGLVLADNYAQTLALSIMESRAAERLGEHARLIRTLESRGLLDRGLEFLPGDEEIEERLATGRGLTRPELAIVLAYSKLELIESLAGSDIPDDPYLGTELESYFPPPLRAPIGGLIRKHRLARQIIAMLVGGSMINRMGPFFVLRAEEETGTSVAQIARAYAIVRDVFDVRRLWREIEALDYAVPAKAQYDSIFEIGRMVRRAVYWFLQNYSHDLDIEASIARFRPGVLGLMDRIDELVGGRSAELLEERRRRLAELGLPPTLGARVAALSLMTQVLDIVELAHEFRQPPAEIATLYFALANELKLDSIREQIEGLKVDSRWRAMARATLRETLAKQQRALLRSALAASDQPGGPAGSLAAWLERHRPEIARACRALDDMQASGPADFATLSVALNEVGRLV